MGMGHGHLLTVEEEEDNEEWEQSFRDGGNYTKTLLDKLKKERENVKRSRNRRPITLLKFLRHVVLAFKKHAMANCNVFFLIEASAMVHSNGCQADTLGRLTRPS
jgi:hypothetical protein